MFGHASLRRWSLDRNISMAVFCGLVTLGSTAVALENQRLRCTGASAEDVRILEVVYEADGAIPCRTEYTKWGKVRIVGQASQAAGFCERMANAIAGKLIKAGFDCGTAGLMEGASAPSAPAQSVATRSSRGQDPQAVAYIEAITVQAESGQRWAADELALIQAIGLDEFYRRWKTELFASVDVNHDGRHEWLVRTADCTGHRCQHYLLQHSVEPGPSGEGEMMLLMVAATPSLQAFNCAVPRGQLRPVYAQGRSGDVNHFRVYEAAGDAYRERHHCVESSGSGGVVEISWPLKGGRQVPEQDVKVTRGETGDCRKAYQGLYPNCFVPK